MLEQLAFLPVAAGLPLAVWTIITTIQDTRVRVRRICCDYRRLD